MKNIPALYRPATQPPEKPAAAAAAVVPLAKVRVLGESDENELCVITLDPSDWEHGVDAQLLMAMICSELDACGLFPDLAPSTMLLLSHPDRHVIADSTLVRGGTTVHLCPNKGRDAASLRNMSTFQQQQLQQAQGTIVYFKEDLCLHVPDDVDNIIPWMCDALGLDARRYCLVTLADGTQWLDELPAPAAAAAPRRAVKRDNGNYSDTIKELMDDHNDDEFETVPVQVHTSSSSNLVIPRNSRWAPPLPQRKPNPTPAQQVAEALRRKRALSATCTHATIVLPGGATEDYEVPAEGVPAVRVLEDVCMMRSLNPSHWTLMEHNLPMFAVHVDAGYSYDLKVKNPKIN